jgi:hypothetical protein
VECRRAATDGGMNGLRQIRTSTKKVRGIASKTRDLRGAIISTFNETEKPVTTRQMFYMISVRGAVEKNEAGYRQVQRQLVLMRRAKIIPYGWIADSTRWMRKPRTYSGTEEALRRTADLYRRAVWDGLDSYVEVWIEKDALAGVLYPITEQYDVPLMVARGYSSESFAYESAENIMEQEKQAYIYYLGDFDPSGWQMAINLEEKLKGFGADITFTRLAITPSMTSKWWNLPTRPTKTTDTRCKDFFDRFGKDTPSIELDALPPDVLREIVRDAIEQHIPVGHLDTLAIAENSERNLLERMVEIAAGGAG